MNDNWALGLVILLGEQAFALRQASMEFIQQGRVIEELQASVKELRDKVEGSVNISDDTLTSDAEGPTIE